MNGEKVDAKITKELNVPENFLSSEDAAEAKAMNKFGIESCDKITISGPGIKGEAELPGMPSKELQITLAEEIVEIKNDIKSMKENLDMRKQRLINEMRLRQNSYIRIKGFEFKLDLKDTLEIKKEKKS